MEEVQDVLQDSCAVFGCVAAPKVCEDGTIFEYLYLALNALQHRGQESSGMVISNGTEFHAVKGMGLVSSVYSTNTSTIPGCIGIGHNRYSTAGKSSLTNCQPFIVHTIYGQIAVAHNGELVNADKIRKKLLKHGVGLSTETDSELIIQLLVHEPPDGEPNGVDWLKRIKNLMSMIHCSYSIVLMTSQKEIYAFRDPYGNRPLCLGTIDICYSIEKDGTNKKSCLDGTVYVVSSESCAFSSLGGQFCRDVEPGEIVSLTEDGIKSLYKVNRPLLKSAAFCIFEYVYFARADSQFEGQIVHTVRKECGRQLAKEAFVEADIVSTIPDSATPAARGFSLHSGIPFEAVVVKNRYVGRTFIQPNAAQRKRGVATKFGPIIDNIKGKRIILIDDSIVRGNTMPQILELLRKAGAKEIHIRIASPPLKYPCFMGINIPTSAELIANKYDPKEMAAYYKVESLVYLSIEGLQKVVSSGIKDATDTGHCKACLTGQYPVELEW